MNTFLELCLILITKWNQISNIIFFILAAMLTEHPAQCFSFWLTNFFPETKWFNFNSIPHFSWNPSIIHGGRTEADNQCLNTEATPSSSAYVEKEKSLCGSWCPVFQRFKEVTQSPGSCTQHDQNNDQISCERVKVLLKLEIHVTSV